MSNKGFKLFIFGEGEKGPLRTPLKIQSLLELFEKVGSPPKDTQGIAYAIEAILSRRELFYYRVEEEGFSHLDYLSGVEMLHKKGKTFSPFAIGIPGVGDKTIIDSFISISKKLQAPLILTQGDFYDYLTGSKY